MKMVSSTSISSTSYNSDNWKTFVKIIAQFIQLYPNLIHNFFCILAFFIVLPIIIIVFLPLKIYKIFVTFLVRLYRRDLGEGLTSYDTIFAIDNWKIKPYAANATILFVNGNLDINTIRQTFFDNILFSKDNQLAHNFEKLCQIPYNYGGYYFWKPIPNFDLKKQIRIVHRFDQTNDEIAENELETKLAKIMNEPFGDALWEILVLANYKSASQTVLVFRLHHVLGDGYSFNHLIDRLIGQNSKYMVKKEHIPWTKHLRLILTGPAKMLQLYLEAFTHEDMFTQKKSDADAVVALTSIDLKLVKKIRRATNSHFATIGMCLLGGALRRFIKRHFPNETIPKWISLMHSLPRSGHPLSKMVNHWGVGLFKIPLCVESPLNRIQQAENDFGKYMLDGYKELIHSHMPLFALLPSPLVSAFFSTNFGTGSGFTSVPGFDRQAYIGGQPVLQMYKIFGLQWKETAVAAAVYTHNGLLSYTIFGNKDVLKSEENVKLLVKTYLHEELHDLMKELNMEMPPSNSEQNNNSYSNKIRAFST